MNVRSRKNEVGDVRSHKKVEKPKKTADALDRLMFRFGPAISFQGVTRLVVFILRLLIIVPRPSIGREQ